MATVRLVSTTGFFCFLLLFGAGETSSPLRGSLLPVPFVAQPSPQTCLVASGASMLRFYGDPITVTELLWRSMQMWRDGSSYLELEQAARARGYETMTVAADETHLAALLQLGIPPIIAIARGGKHTVVVQGYDPILDRFVVLDSLHGSEELSRAALAALRQPYAQQTLLIAPPRMRLAERLRAAGLPWETWREQATRFRVDEYLRRAEQLSPEALPQRQALYEAAWREEPGNAELAGYVIRMRHGITNDQISNTK